jgi:hypothetical protein
MAASGISYTRFINKQSYAKIIFSGLYENSSSQVDSLDVSRVPHRIADHNIAEYRGSVTTIFGTKLNSKLNSKFGVTVDRMGYDLNTKAFSYDSMSLMTLLKGSKGLLDGPTLFRSFGEASYKINDNVILNPGLQFMYFGLNNQKSLEPRLGLSWMYAKNRRLNFGYGLQSRLNSLSTYFLGTYAFETTMINGIPVPQAFYIETNKYLGFIKSNQFVIGHDWNITNNLRLKIESYYQYLFNVPVETRPTYYSILNTGTDWGIAAQDSLVNKGTGYNYGCEITFEKFLSRNYYFLFTSSLFNSKYRGSDGILRNTTYNGNFVFNFLLGYELMINSKWSLTFDEKATYAGGIRYVPIDSLASKAANATRYDYADAYKNRFPDYFKMDLKIGMRFNGRRVTQEWQLYMENVTNHQNILDERYSRTSGQIIKTYQLGRFPGNFPLVLYRLNF